MRLALLLLAVPLVAGACSSGTDRPTAPSERAPAPPLAATPPADGEVLLRGRVAPRSHRAVALHGRYLVRFAQWAPEDATRDFGGETSFVASLEGVAGGARGQTVPLFEASAARGAKRVRLNGRYVLEVAFGDFPYVVRFTPVG